MNSIVGESGCAPDERRVYAVAGSKNLGKSTFARQLVNILLNDHAEVGYLDTDLGQPEFTVPGMKHSFCLLSLLPRKTPVDLEQRRSCKLAALFICPSIRSPREMFLLDISMFLSG